MPKVNLYIWLNIYNLWGFYGGDTEIVTFWVAQRRKYFSLFPAFFSSEMLLAWMLVAIRSCGLGIGRKVSCKFCSECKVSAQFDGYVCPSVLKIIHISIHLTDIDDTRNGMVTSFRIYFPPDSNGLRSASADKNFQKLNLIRFVPPERKSTRLWDRFQYGG
jgi:hypothetical protein